MEEEKCRVGRKEDEYESERIALPRLSVPVFGVGESRDDPIRISNQLNSLAGRELRRKWSEGRMKYFSDS